MSDEENRLSVPAAGQSVTEADRLADAIVAVLDRLEARIPDVRPPDPATAGRARGARTVSPEFVSSLIAMVDASPALQALGKLDREKARRVLQSRDSYRRIAERLTILLETINHTREAQWAEVVGEAMATYKTANAIVDLPGNQSLIPHLKILRRHLGRTSGPKRKKESDKG